MCSSKSCHRQVEFSDGKPDDRSILDVSAVTRSMSRSNGGGSDACRNGDSSLLLILQCSTSIRLLPSFTPKRLRTNRVPQNYRPKVDRQMSELQCSEVSSSRVRHHKLLIVFFKSPDADGIRKLLLAVLYAWVNKIH